MTERRLDPITGGWRTFAEPPPAGGTRRRDDRCPLCPAIEGGRSTSLPWSSFDVAVFDNPFPVLAAEPPSPSVAAVGVYRVDAAAGATEMIVYSDDHQASLGSLGSTRVRLLVDVWADRYAALGAREGVAYVLVAESRGRMLRQNLAHPHGEVFAYPGIPPLAARELAEAQEHLLERGTCVMCDVVSQERLEGVRIVARSDAFVAYVPFAARFAYEVHIVAQRHVPSLLDLSDIERGALATLISDVAARYDNLFGFRLPYVMSLHQAPTDDGGWEPVSHFHIEFTPFHWAPDERRSMGSFELGGGEFSNHVAPEEAAAALRAATSAD